jgi:hypothetical protein
MLALIDRHAVAFLLGLLIAARQRNHALLLAPSVIAVTSRVARKRLLVHRPYRCAVMIDRRLTVRPIMRGEAQCPQLGIADIGLSQTDSVFDVVDGARSRRRIAVR